MEMTLDDARGIGVLVKGGWSGGASPDGRWLACVSNRSGRDEIYASPL